MARQRLRPRSWIHFHRWKTTNYLFVLGIAFISSLIAFSVTFYLTSDYLFDLVSYLFTPELSSLQVKSLIPNTAENYQPRDFFGKSQSVNYDYYIKYNDFDYLKPESLTYKSQTYSNHIEILFRFPKKTSISALLLIFHACQHSAYEWFHTAERQRIIGAAVDLGYACLVFQATNKNSQCWSNVVDIYENKDIQMVLKGLDGFYKEYPDLATLPRFTFGVSSGGIFSSIFAINQLYGIQGQILYTSIILPEILYTYVKAKNYPPTAWIHMLRDIEFASEERINISKQIFIEHNIPHSTFPIEPTRVSYSTFHARIPSISGETSRFLFYRLQQNRWINYFNFLAYNPRRKLAWKTFLFPSSAEVVNSEEMFNNLNKNKDRISELLNTIYGEHAISYERSYEALKWFRQFSISPTKST